MKKSKKILSMLITLLLFAIMLVGCGTNTSDVSNENSSVTSEDLSSNTAKDTNGKVFKIGISQIAQHTSLDNCREGFIAGLAESGYVEGENVTFDYQNASNEPTNASMISDNFVSKQYDLICGISTPSAMAAFNSALDSNIPVIFTAVSDPIAAELVDSLEAPGKNCTGTSDALPLEAQMKMIRDFLPTAKTIGILYTTSEVNSLTQLEKFKELAPNYGFEIEAIGVNNSADIPLAVDTLLTKVDCINNFTDNNVVNNLDTLVSKATEANIPVFGSEEEQVKKGCIASQSIDYYELGKETGKMAAKVLDGTSASEIPVEVISASTPVANQEAMDTLGITLPEAYKDSITYLSAEN